MLLRGISITPNNESNCWLFNAVGEEGFKSTTRKRALLTPSGSHTGIPLITPRHFMQCGIIFQSNKDVFLKEVFWMSHKSLTLSRRTGIQLTPGFKTHLGSFISNKDTCVFTRMG